MTLEELTKELAEWDRLSTVSAYAKAKLIAAGMSAFPSAKELSDWIEDTTGSKMPAGTITKNVAWGSLLDDRAAFLGLTRGYKTARVLRDGSLLLDECLLLASRAADPADPYLWATYDADVLGNAPAVEHEWCECPVCHKRHTLSDKKTSDAPES